MRQTNTNTLKVQTRLCILLILCALSAAQDYEEGDSCDFSGYSGTCLAVSKCYNLPALTQALGLRPHQIGSCGFLVYEEMICCPFPVVQGPPNILDPFKPFTFRPPRVESTTKRVQIAANTHKVPDDKEENLNALLQTIFSRNVNENLTVGRGIVPTTNTNDIFLQLINKNKPKSVSTQDAKQRMFDISMPAYGATTVKPSQAVTGNLIVEMNRLGNDTVNENANTACQTRHYKGVCLARWQCTHLAQTLMDMRLNGKDVTPCEGVDIICCPNIERPAVRACHDIERALMPFQGAHILGGHRVSVMQYPHMAYIVYDNVNMVCGGTLIHKRFVLTAAHCVIVRDANPIKVIMGISDLNDPEKVSHRQEIGIEAVYEHTKYSSFSKYFDIAVIELAADVKFGPNVYPTCLYAEETELPDGIQLTAAGWGRTENQSVSKHLLAVNLYQIPHEECNQSYVKHIDRSLDHGIEATQLCALARGKDTCAGDSGGPLLLVKNESYNSYRVVGVVSFGSIICGQTVPGVYTRVSQFLDFIEAIVWPELLRNR